MTVVKRDGTSEPMFFDKIMKRIKTLSAMEPALAINCAQLAIKVVSQLHSGISTSLIDELTAQECAARTDHPDYAVLAGRVVVSNNHKNTQPGFLETTALLEGAGLLNETYAAAVRAKPEAYQAMLEYDLDYTFDYFGFKTLERAYLMRVRGTIVERPQHMWLRVAIALHGRDLPRVAETYHLLANKVMTHATPTLFNAGTPRQQLSSCFLLGVQSDSIDGIYETLKDCAAISKWAGGIGLHIHNVRSKGAFIQGTNGSSNGIVPMLRVFNETARYVDQGGGKRNGSFAIYLSPDHADIEAWLDLKKNTGDESARARDLFYGLWVPDLFMKRVKANEAWSLFCPKTCPGLADVHSEAYEALYAEYEAAGVAAKTLPARTLWFKILDAQMETGTPYLLYKDACNRKSNQQNVGCIKSSNLCTEIIQYSDSEETAVCNLASISLAAFVRDKIFQYERLHATVKVLTRNLNRVIDITYYPTPGAERSNLRHRPLGLGVQGLADAFFLMDLAFYSEAAAEVNRHIFETIYHAAMETSVELAVEEGPYPSFQGSPLSQGKFQFDLWNVVPGRYDWGKLRERVLVHGARNSLLVAPMPTASTSQILGNNECFEPITSNIYTRRTAAGEFVVVNKYLVQDLQAMNLWDEAMKTDLVKHRGSVQHLDLPAHFKNKYRTVWEIPMKHLINLARDRAPFICQSQSLNLWMEDPTYPALTSMHFYSWECGLKTGMYYLRRKPKYQPQQFTVEPCLTCTA